MVTLICVMTGLRNGKQLENKSKKEKAKVGNAIHQMNAKTVWDKMSQVEMRQR